MQTLNQIVIKAPIQKVYSAAERIVDWPRLLPHYRWVTIFEDKGKVRQVEMAASRNGFPCKWQSEQRLYPAQNKIFYLHTRAFWTKGMEVWWILKTLKGGKTQVILSHDMPPAKNFFLAWFRRHVVGRLFVENIAEKTLVGIKRHLELP